MIIANYLSRKITDVLSEGSIISNDNKEEYIYCFEYFFDVVIYNSSLVIIGFLLHDICAAFICMLCMVFMKACAGGYHASSRLRCSILSYTVFFTVLIAYKNLPASGSVFWENYRIGIHLFYLTVAVTVAVLSPVESRYKHIVPSERKKIKKISVVVIISISMLYFIIWFGREYKYSGLIMLCLMVTLVNQFVGLASGKTN